MTVETRSSRPPREILEAARDFFLGPDRVADAWIESESETHLGLNTFRGNLSIAALPASDDGEETLVRITTLRDEGIVPRLLAYLRLPSGTAGAA